MKGMFKPAFPHKLGPIPDFIRIPLADAWCMHPLFLKADALSKVIIGAAIEMHNDKGPGLIESIFEWCLTCELSLQNLTTEAQRVVPISYKQFTREVPLRFDLLVESCVLVETKS